MKRIADVLSGNSPTPEEIDAEHDKRCGALRNAKKALSATDAGHWTRPQRKADYDHHKARLEAMGPKGKAAAFVITRE